MKKLNLTFLLVLSGILGAQNFEISTLRMGDFKIFMNKADAEKLAKKSLLETADPDKPNKINYNGENIDILFTQRYVNENSPNVVSVYVLQTKSKKFKTKSGMGVGNTKDELINTYRNYPNFRVNQYKENNKNESFFTLNDFDAGTFLNFKMINNVVTEIIISMDEGC